MKLRIIITDSEPEEILIYARKRTPLIDEIERLAEEENSRELIGYANGEATKLDPFRVTCCIVENGRVFALTDERLQVKLRLYQVEELLDTSFIKINQSCIANVRQIERVKATFSGSLCVVFKNGYTDYISRRNLKKVKERLGVKL